MKFKLIILILVLLSTQSNLYAQIISISDARTKTEGSTVTVNGVITAGEFGDLQYVQDATGGIAVYSSSTSGLKRG
nr:hypothetical protein [Bacteroidota bacterium]